MASSFIRTFREGGRHQRDLLGGKGANLAEMTTIGLPVPPGFTLTTEACRHYMEHGDLPDGLLDDVAAHMTTVEDELGRTFGGSADPLLVSVRSGAAVSMPGMMETVLNVGLNDETTEALARTTGNDRFAQDSYRRLLQMFGSTVLGVDGALFEDVLDEKKDARGAGTSDAELDTADFRAIVERFKAIIERETGSPFPQDPIEQLRGSILAVFDSWNTERAVLYRRREHIPHDLGTAVTICSMVFGNRDDDSATGVCFTRDPAEGHGGIYGDFLINAQGEDVVAGVRNTQALVEMEQWDRPVFEELKRAMETLENHYQDMCDIEFTIESGTLWMLQTRVGKRTPAAAFRIANQLVAEGLIDAEEALMRVGGEQLTQLMFPRFDRYAERDLIGSGINASPGAAVGRIVFDSDTAAEWKTRGERVILVRRETTPDDLKGMIASTGVLTSRGGRTSHAAVVARGMGIPCVAGVESFDIDHREGAIHTGDGRELHEGDTISFDGGTGEVYVGEVPVVPSDAVEYFEGTLGPDHRNATELVKALHTVMTTADAARRLDVRTNADTATDTERALRFGARGIGLCRTEHMFFGKRKQFVEDLVLAADGDEESAALAKLEEVQRRDFTKLLRAADGHPVTVRLLDPPLHEFLPDLTELSIRVARAEDRGAPDAHEAKLLAAVHRMHEQNPMLGLRGVRLGLTIPDLYTSQARAALRAAADLERQGITSHVEIMIPLVATARELSLMRDEVAEVIEQLRSEHLEDAEVAVGTMIELPRAALTADEIAEYADFFSFGTNDLTQTTWGFSRDDVEAAFIPRYKEQEIFEYSPFETLDREGVGALVEMGVQRGRAAKPGLTMGICGEHGGDPASVHFFHDAGLDYVSCSPFRVPVARLEAGRAAIAEKRRAGA